MTTMERSKLGTIVLLTDTLVNVLVRLPVSIFALLTRTEVVRGRISIHSMFVCSLGVGS